MPKKKKSSWFHRLRDYFVVTDHKQQQQEEGKRKQSRWVFRWMRTNRPPSLVAPTSSNKEQPSPRRSSTSSSTSGLKKSKNRHRKNSTTGSTLVSDHDNISAKDAPTVVGAVDSPPPCSKNPRSIDQTQNAEVTLHKKNEVNHRPMRSRRQDEDDRQCSEDHRRRHAQVIVILKHHHRHAEAIVIQTAFRGYLARKALKALKGLVRLQAIIRGRAVRRQAAATLKCLESIVNIQSQICATRYHMAQQKIHHPKPVEDYPAAAGGGGGGVGYYHSKYGQQQTKKVAQMNSRHRRDDSLLTEEESFVLLGKKAEAMMGRERMFNARHSAEYEDGRAAQRLRNWVERYVSDHDQLPQMEDIKRVDTIGGKPHHHHHHHHDHHQHQLKLISKRIDTHDTLQHPQCIHGPDTPALMHPRRTLLQKKRQQQQRSTTATLDPRSVEPALCATTMPTYMAATESAKAKARSTTTSSPTPAIRRLRRVQSDVCSDGDYSPYKCRFSPVSSINSERTWSGSSVISSGIRNINAWSQNNNSPVIRSYNSHCSSKGCTCAGANQDSLRSSTGSSNSKDLGFDQFQTWALNWN